MFWEGGMFIWIVPISFTSVDSFAATWLQVKDILFDCNLSSPGTRPKKVKTLGIRALSILLSVSVNEQCIYIVGFILHRAYIMQPLNLIVHNTSQLLDRMGRDAGNELYFTALHLIRPYQVRRVGNTKVFFPLLCLTNVLLLQIRTHCSVIRINSMKPFSSNTLHGFERDVSSSDCDCETSPQQRCSSEGMVLGGMPLSTGNVHNL